MEAHTKRLLGYAFLLVPVLVVTLLDYVPKFVYSSCTYYTCDPYTFSVTAWPSSIALDESSSLEGINANCPCTWQIESQPGGWELEVLSDCRATLKPIAGFGYAGDIVVRATSSGSSGCSETITVTAGCPTFRVQVSTDGGYSWVNDGLTLTGNPLGQIDFAARVVMTATSGTVDGWSFSLKHDASSLRAAGGDLEVLDVTTVGTHTETVQKTPPPDPDLPPDFEETSPRQGVNGSLGYVQGVVIDFDETAIMLDPVGSFVSSGGCYKLTLPYYAGIYQVPFTFVDDIGDGNPPVHTLVSEDNVSVTPNLRAFVLTVDANSGAGSSSSCDLTQIWVTSADGIPGPTGGCGGSEGAGGGGCGLDSGITSGPPVSLADTDNNSSVNLNDAIFLLRYLFRSGQEPAVIDTTRVLKTGQTKCFDADAGNELDPCPSEGDFLFGQDANYVNLNLGLPRHYFLAPDSDGDASCEAVIDVRTGLMWQRSPQDVNIHANGGILFDLQQAIAEVNDINNATLESFSDWRLPELGELLSVFDFSRLQDENTLEGAAVPTIFDWGAMGRHFWSATDYLPDTSRQWRINPYLIHTGHTSDDACRGFVVVREAKVLPPNHQGAMEVPANRQFHLGDFDLAQGLNLTDAVAILQFLFRGGATPPAFTVKPIVPTSIVPGRFVDNLNGTITDSLTGLTWLQSPTDFPDPSAGLLLWEEALEKAETLDLAGNEDWRLPNFFELATLVDFSVSDTATPAMDPLFTSFDPTMCDFVSNPNCVLDPAHPEGCWVPYWGATTALDGTRAHMFFPSNAISPGTSGVAMGALRCVARCNAGLKGSIGWVLAVRGPD